MYLGEVEICYEEVASFLQVSQNLFIGISGLIKKIRIKIRINPRNLALHSPLNFFLQAGIDLGVKGLKNKEGMDVGLDFKNDQKTESGAFPKQEVAEGNFGIAPMNDEKLDERETKQVNDDQRTENAAARLPKDEEIKKEKRKLSCAFCEYKTAKASHMQRHMKGVHKFLELIKSEKTAEVGLDEQTISKKENNIPDLTLSEEVALEQNLATANDPNISIRKESKCGNCNLNFSGQKHLRRHFLSFHTGKRYSCEECNFTTNRNDTLKTHRNTKGHKMQVYLQEETLLI